VKEISAGEGIGRYEAPRGEVFHYVRTDGTNRVVRHKVRAPSFNNIPTFQASCKGIPIADALITLAGVDPCYCCTERAIRVSDKHNKNKKIDLLKLSRDKTSYNQEECLMLNNNLLLLILIPLAISFLNIFLPTIIRKILVFATLVVTSVITVNLFNANNETFTLFSNTIFSLDKNVLLRFSWNTITLIHHFDIFIKRCRKKH